MNNYHPGNETKLSNLRYWNALACLFHFVQSLTALLLAITDSTFSSFQPNLITTFANWNETMGANTEIQVRGRIPFAYVTCLVPFMSAIAHGLICSPYFWPRYVNHVRHLQNPWRWIEYAFSSSLMIVLVAILFAIYDISLLITLFAINFTVMYTGRAMDRVNVNQNIGQNKSSKDLSTHSSTKIDWEPFIAGSLLALIEWIIIYMTLAQFDYSRAPAYIIPLLFTYFVLFCSFAIVDAWYYYYERDLERMLTAEKMFMLLSLSAKSLLLWLIFFGTRQPNEN